MLNVYMQQALSTLYSMHFENYMYYDPEDNLDKAQSVLYQHAVPTIFDVTNSPKRTEVSRRLPTKRRTDNNNVDYLSLLLRRCPTLEQELVYDGAMDF
jgi:hypothetical protein